MPVLSDARLKFEWAEKHIIDLQLEISKFCDSSPRPYTLGSKPHHVSQIRHTTVFVDRLQRIPESIPLRLGDAVHNLRSTLDYIAYEMVRSNGKTPTRDTHFPIGDPAKEHKPSFGKTAVKGMSVDAQRMIVMLQPNNSCDSTLWNLHSLDIADKHRLLVTAQLASQAWGVDAFGSGNDLYFDQNTAVREGYEIVNIPDSTFERQKLDDFKLVLDIAFGDAEILQGQSIIETLHNMANRVKEIIGRFASLTDGRA